MNILVSKEGGGSREALVLIASDCFEKIMINHFRDKVLTPYISEMLEILLYQVKSTRNKQLIELIFNLVKKQPEKVKEFDTQGSMWANRIFNLFSEILTEISDLDDQKDN